MFENLLLVSIAITVFWLLSYGLYWYSSNQHQDLQQDVEALRRDLSDPAD